MNKQTVNKIAKAYAASIVFEAMGNGAYSVQMTDSETEYLCACMNKIADRLCNEKFADLEQIVKYYTK